MRFATVSKSRPACSIRGASFLYLRLDVHVRGELHEIQVAGKAAWLEQVRGGEILQGDVNSRGEACRGRGFARHFGQRAGNSESGLADLDQVARLRSELKKKTFFRDRFSAIAKSVRGRRRRGFHLAIKGKIPAQGAHMDKPGAATFREERHGAETHLSRLRFP